MTRVVTIPLALCALLTSGGCEEPPVRTPARQLTSASPFHYPEEQWDAEVEGKTTLRLFVSAQGRVDSVRVHEPALDPAFDSAAVKGAPQLRFEPARVGAEPVGEWVLLPVHFDMPRGDTSAAP